MLSPQAEAAVQADWAAHLHARYFCASRGELAPLKLGTSEALSRWAVSMVRSRTFSGEARAAA